MTVMDEISTVDGGMAVGGQGAVEQLKLSGALDGLL